MPGTLGLLGPELIGTERLPAKGTATTGPAPAPTPPPLHQLPYEPHEFGRFKRLGKKGVNADVESALDLVLRTGTDNGEGKIPGPGVGTQPGGGTQPVEPRHDHIQGHHIGPHVMHDVQAFGTVGRGHDLDALQLEIDPDQLPDDLVVVHNKHPAGRAWHNSRVGPRPPRRPGFPHFHPRAGVATTPRTTPADASPPPPPNTAPPPHKPMPVPHERAGRVLPVAANTAPDTPP